MKNALSNKIEISKLLKSGNKLYTKSLCIISSSLNTESTQYLIMVAKKHFKLATIRNKIRRQLRAIIQSYNDLNNIKRNFILIVKSDYNIKNFLEHKNNLFKILRKL